MKPRNGQRKTKRKKKTQVRLVVGSKNRTEICGTGEGTMNVHCPYTAGGHAHLILGGEYRFFPHITHRFELCCCAAAATTATVAIGAVRHAASENGKSCPIGCAAIRALRHKSIRSNEVADVSVIHQRKFLSFVCLCVCVLHKYCVQKSQDARVKCNAMRCQSK